MYKLFLTLPVSIILTFSGGLQAQIGLGKIPATEWQVQNLVLADRELKQISDSEKLRKYSPTEHSKQDNLNQIRSIDRFTHISGNEDPLNDIGMLSAGFSSDPFYLKRSKAQKKAAWILLGGGTAMIIVGAIGFSSTWDSDSYTATDVFGVIMLGGVVFDLFSIPLFVSSGISARKGTRVTLSNKKRNLFISDYGNRAPQPSISFEMNF